MLLSPSYSYFLCLVLFIYDLFICFIYLFVLFIYLFVLFIYLFI